MKKKINIKFYFNDKLIAYLKSNLKRANYNDNFKRLDLKLNFLFYFVFSL